MGVSDIIRGMEEQLVNDGQSDFIFMNVGVNTIAHTLNIILGLLITFVAIGLPIIIAIEVFYINFPVVQSGIYKLSKKSDAIEKIMGLCLRDAKLAIRRANEINTGASANKEYLKIKVKTVFIVFIVIGIVSGPINTIVQVVLNIIADFFHAFL